MLEQVYDQIYNALFAQGNQFLQGGLILGALASVGYWLRSLPMRLWNLFLFYGTVTVDVLSTDKAYRWLLLWLELQPYMKKSRRVSVRDIRDKQGEEKALLVPSRGRHWFFYKGSPLWLTRGKESEGGGAPPNASASSWQPPIEILTIRVVGRRRDRINAIIEEAKRLYEHVASNKLKVFTRRYSDWESILKPKRPIESVFMPPSGERLLDDMRKFLRSEDWYRSMGVPYRRGYLFHGPAGTGKSSAAEALASELDIPIYTINLAKMYDTDMENAIAELDTRTPFILLLEDVDTVVGKREVKDAEKDDNTPVAPAKLSLGTLLNCLDGLLASDRCILVMTTNHLERLDPALKRKGRTDVHVEFGYSTDAQINAAVKRFLPNATEEQWARVRAMQKPFPFCDLQELLKEMALENIQAVLDKEWEDKVA